MTSATSRLSASFSLGCLLFLVALAIRLVGIDWGLPNERRFASLHPDEPINWAVTRQVNPLGGDFDPNFYNYGTLFFTIHRIAWTVSGLGSEEPTLGLMRAEILVSRGLTAALGAGIVVFVFAMLFRLVNPVGAVAGALLVMVAPGMVVHSRFMTVDVLSAFFVAGALWFSLRSYLDQDAKFFLWAGVFAGLAAGAKYNGILVILALAPAVIRLKPGERLKVVAGGIGASVLTFLITVPGVFLNTSAFLRDVGYEMWHVSTGHGMVFIGTAPGGLFHLGNLMEAVGLLLVLMSAVGLLWALRLREEQWVQGLVLFGGVYFLLIARAEVKFLRYVLPLVPVLAVGFGWLIGRLHEREDKRWRLGVALGAFALVGLGRGGLVSTLEHTTEAVSPDPRDAVADHLRGKASVGLVSDPWFYSPTLYPQVGLTRAVPFAKREAFRLASADPRVLRFVPANPDERVDWDIRLLSELRPEYVVYSSFETEGYDRIVESDRPEAQRFVAFLRQLAEDYTLDRIEGSKDPSRSHDMMYVRPTLWVWKRR